MIKIQNEKTLQYNEENNNNDAYSYYNGENNFISSNQNLKKSYEDTLKNYFLPKYLEELPGNNLNSLIAKEEAQIFKSYLTSDNIDQRGINNKTDYIPIKFIGIKQVL